MALPFLTYILKFLARQNGRGRRGAVMAFILSHVRLSRDVNIYEGKKPKFSENKYSSNGDFESESKKVGGVFRGKQIFNLTNYYDAVGI